MKRAAAAVALVLMGFALAALLAEGLARLVVPRAGTIAFVPDSVLGFRHAPAQRRWSGNGAGEFGLWFTTNSAGHPDVERSAAAQPGTYRVALIGDSMLEAAQVPHEARFSTLLERALNASLSDSSAYDRVEVLNFGVASYGTTQQWLQYRTEVRQYRPDAVFLMFFPPNDVRNNSYALDVVAAGRPQVAPYYRLDTAGELVPVEGDFHGTARQLYGTAQTDGGVRGVYRQLRQRSRLVQLVDPLLRQQIVRRPGTALPLEAAVNRDVYRRAVQDTSAAWREAWDVTEAVVRRLEADVEADGAAFRAVILSGPAEVHPELRSAMIAGLDEAEFDWDLPNRRSAELLQRAGAAHTNVLPAARAAAGSGESIHFRTDGHYTPAGHRVVADVVLPAMRSVAHGR